MGLVLDTGALIGFERGDREIAALVEAVRRRGERATTSSGCVAQAWRDGSRQALLASLLKGLDEQRIGSDTSRAVGVLCGKADVTDVVDAHVSLLARDDDIVLTSDAGDIGRLLRARGCQAAIKRC